MPQFDSPVEGTSKDQAVEGVELGRVVNGKAAQGSVVLIKKSHFLVCLVVQGTSIEDSVERPQIVIVGVSNGEPRAGDVDIM